MGGEVAADPFESLVIAAISGKLISLVDSGDVVEMFALMSSLILLISSGFLNRRVRLVDE